MFSLAAVLFTPLQLWVGRRFEKRRAYLLGMLSWLLATPAEPDLVLYAPGPHDGLRVWRLTGGDRGAASDGRSG